MSNKNNRKDISGEQNIYVYEARPECSTLPLSDTRHNTVAAHLRSLQPPSRAAVREIGPVSRPDVAHRVVGQARCTCGGGSAGRERDGPSPSVRARPHDRAACCRRSGHGHPSHPVRRPAHGAPAARARTPRPAPTPPPTPYTTVLYKGYRRQSARRLRHPALRWLGYGHVGTAL